MVDLSPEMSTPYHQEEDGICVSVCMTDILTLLYKSTGRKYRKHVDFFYKRRSDKRVNGMSPRNAFEIAQANGLVTAFAILKNLLAIKVAILANGPVLIALPVYNLTNVFWQKPDVGMIKPQGYHAVTLVGYDDKQEQFKLRNSWGTEWADRGYTYFPYEDMHSVMEAWTAFK